MEKLYFQCKKEDGPISESFYSKYEGEEKLRENKNEDKKSKAKEQNGFAGSFKRVYRKFLISINNNKFGMVASLCVLGAVALFSNSYLSQFPSLAKSYSYNSTSDYNTTSKRCAHSGCSNKKASSGDTSYCTTHSRRCLECNCYIDEDAVWCISCLVKAMR